MNLLLLLVVSFLPFPTGLLSEFYGHPDAERVALTLYGFTLLAASGMIAVLWKHARRERLIHQDLKDQDARDLAKRLNPSLWGYAGMIPAGLLIPQFVVLGYLAIAVLLIPPTEMFRRDRI